MSRTHLIRTLYLGLWSGALLYAPAASSDPQRPKEQRSCASAYEREQELERSAQLRLAREVVLTCARSACGNFLLRQCSTKYNQLESEIPTVIFVARDGDAESLVDVQVTVDGELLTSKLDGRPLPIDPGLHDFSFKTNNGAAAVQRMLIVQGQHNRTIAVSLRAPEKRSQKVAVFPPAPPQPETKTSPSKPASDPSPEIAKATPDTRPENGSSGGTRVAPYVAGGLGLAGVGGFAVLFSWAMTDNEKLLRCSPDCAQASVDRVRNLYIAADVSLGAGIIGLGAAAWMFLAADPATRAQPGPSAYVVDVKPSRSGFFATVSSTF
jgi:hypothetical protein